MSTKRSRRKEREKQKNAPKPAPKTPRQRIFTEEFKIGESVAIIRHDHGWEDGRVVGKITSLSPSSATVESEDGGKYFISHCRNIRKAF